MPKNKNAGKHPSYEARGMSAESIRKKRAYDKALGQKPAQKKKRVECNKKRAEAKSEVKNISGKDYDHSTKRFVSTSTNRGRKGEGGRVKK